MHPCRLECTSIVDGASALPSVTLFSCPGGPAFRPWRELQHNEMAAGDGKTPKTSPPQPFDFPPHPDGILIFYPAAIIISELRTAFESPNSHLGCPLVLSAESRGNSQGAWSCREENHLHSVPGAACLCQTLFPKTPQKISFDSG